MTDVIWEWVRNYAGVNASRESDFSNGYKIGELLSRYNQQLDFPQAFWDSELIDAKVQNFAALQPSLRNLGIKLKASEAEAIMGNQYEGLIDYNRGHVSINLYRRE